MQELTRTDVHFVVARLPQDVRELLEQKPAYLGGGYIRASIAGKRPNDIDLFGPSESELKAWAEGLKNLRIGARTYKTDNAITVLNSPRLPVQFITRWVYDDAEKVAASFDYTIAQAVIWFNAGKMKIDDGLAGWQSACSAGFYPDLAARRLVYTSPLRNEDAGGSILRMRKFLGRGYSIQAPSLAAVIARLVSGVDPARCDTRDEKDVSRILLALLREVDPLTLIEGGLEPLVPQINEAA